MTENITNEPSDGRNRYLLLKIMTLQYYLSFIKVDTFSIRVEMFTAVKTATGLLGYDTS